MSNYAQRPWSDNSNAPQIPSRLYFAEKANFAGFLITAIFYGIVVILFFQCLNALLDSVNRTGRRIKWPLVAHCVAMFSIATLYIGTSLNVQAISYVDNRYFPGDGEFFPGPFGFLAFIYRYKTVNIIPTLMFHLNNLLADSFLLYRCYVIYSTNYWAIVFPCLMYIASLVMGIMLIYAQTSQAGCNIWDPSAINIATSYSIYVSLNVVLTVMIVARLVLLRRSIQNALNAPVRVGGLYNALVTMMIESCALYAGTFLLFIGSWAAGSSLMYVFFPVLSQTQVIAPFLITLRVANRSTPASDIIISQNADSIHFSPGDLTGDDGTLPRGEHTSSVGTKEKTTCGLGIAVETTVGMYSDET